MGKMGVLSAPTASLLAALLISLCLSSTHAIAQEVAEEAEQQVEEIEGILPVPDYGKGFWERSHVTGDWGSVRTKWADKGIQFEIDNVNWVDTIVSGGKTNDAEFGANFQYDLKLDLMRAGILPGALIQVRGESRVGSSGILNSGTIVPSNMAALSPTNYSNFDEGFDIALSQLTYLQLFSEHFGVILGKFDMYGEGSPSEFAGGRGRTQFMNWNLNAPTPALFVPASTIGAGAVILPNENLTLTTLVISGTECANSSCFDDLGDSGAISINTASYQYKIDDLPGGVNGSAFFFFDGDFTELGSIGIGIGDGDIGLVGSDKNNSWQTNVSFWQYLSVEEAPEGPLNLLDGQPDLQGWGVFGSLSFADRSTNPFQISTAFGVGGRGVITGRDNDLFGIGGFYNDFGSSRLSSDVGFEDSAAGMEAFYNFAITPAARLSAHAQYLSSVQPGIDDSVMISARFQLVF